MSEKLYICNKAESKECKEIREEYICDHSSPHEHKPSCDLFMCGSDKIYISVQCIEVDEFINENEFKV